MRMQVLFLVGAGVLGASLFAGCGSAEEARGSVKEAQDSVVLIEARGVWSDVFENAEARSVAGTGFVIDDSGHILTNNHVVTGASVITVEDGDQSYPAKLVGKDECADLAVLEVENYARPALQWAGEDPEPDTDVWALGHAGGGDLAVTRGTVRRRPSHQDTSWASVDGVLEHSAYLEGGSSGGPLVLEDGRVVGVNFAQSSNTAIGFAIGGEYGSRITQRLVSGDSSDSIGIAGEAFRVSLDDGTPFFGVWINAVQAGSPAGRAGLQPGDMIATLQSLRVGEDGTLKDYCETIRSNGARAVMDIQVLRFSDDDSVKIMEGQINGAQLR